MNEPTCDECRKAKSKWERSMTQYISYALADTREVCDHLSQECETYHTFFREPSFKQGHPKGYVNAIERRW